MTFEIAIVLAILALAIILFFTEKLRADLVALLILSGLVLTGLISVGEALSGFSSTAVVTVWAVFILSAGLSRTGVASFIGQRILRLAGRREAQIVAVIMLTAGTMSAFMNNVGVAALFLPVVMEISRRMGLSPSRLLMPLAYGSLMGGMITLIGTPSNILVSDLLHEYDLRPFGMFDFAPIGAVVLLAGTVFVALIGRHLLPIRNIQKEFTDLKQAGLRNVYDLSERMFIIRVPKSSALVGKTLAASRFGEALGLNVIGILRNGRTLVAPQVTTILRPDDRLLVVGRAERLENLRRLEWLSVESANLELQDLITQDTEIVGLELPPGSLLVGHTLRGLNFRQRYGVNVIGIRRQGRMIRTHFSNTVLQTGDVLLLHGTSRQIDLLRDNPDFLVSEADHADVLQLHEHLLVVRISPESDFAGKTLTESRLGEALGLTILSLLRQGNIALIPLPMEIIQEGDLLLVEGNPEDLAHLRVFRELEIEQATSLKLDELETGLVSIVEAVLSPHSSLSGHTLKEIHFREKFGVSVLALLREGRVYRSNLGELPLRFGDAFLLHGPREKLKLLGSEPDFLVLLEEAQEAPRLDKATQAVIIMGIVLLPVILGWLPIAIMAILGAVLMVLAGCLTMDEVYSSIEWKAVFLIAGMLPLGIALENTGAAQFLANGLIGSLRSWGAYGALVGFFLLTSLATQAMPTPAVVVLMSPIALNTASEIGLSPYALLMTVAVAASASFLSPVAHPANMLVMGPGGYRFTDYLRLGLPLVLIALAIVLLLLPVLWPLTP
jgi:di/tricarboxylate transporter